MERDYVGAKVKPEQDELHVLHAAANRACERGLSTVDFEPFFARFLDFILANPTCRESASELFLCHIRDYGGCIELVQYCMHELRWPEIEAEVLAEVSRSEDWRVKTALSHVIEAFNDDWSDVDLYERWQTESP